MLAGEQKEGDAAGVVVEEAVPPVDADPEGEVFAELRREVADGVVQGFLVHREGRPGAGLALGLEAPGILDHLQERGVLGRLRGRRGWTRLLQQGQQLWLEHADLVEPFLGQDAAGRVQLKPVAARGDLDAMARRPRRVLQRVRKRTALSRVQQLDSPCLTWLVRQPGRTAVQKAGATQQILSVVRQDNYNTLENRVLKDCLRRCRISADAYLRQCKQYKNSQRVKLVRGFSNQCRMLLREPVFDHVSSLAGVPAPNYVLQFDSTYTKLWQWYLRLVRRQKETEDAWRWQRRLWADLARLCLTSSLLDPDAIGCTLRVSHAQSLWIRNEQHYGSRFTHFDWPTMLLVCNRCKREILVSCIHPVAADERTRTEATHDEWACGKLGADLIITLQLVGGARKVVLFMWALASGISENTLENALESERAHEAIKHVQKWYPGETTLRGLILRSVYGQEFEDLPGVNRDGIEVISMGIPGSPEGWRQDLRDYIHQFVAECVMDVTKAL